MTAAVLPVSIKRPSGGFWARLWRDKPLGAAGAIVLLLFLFLMNGLAIWMRKRFERRW